jgi:mono/diheme cytochrome c family protein
MRGLETRRFAIGAAGLLAFVAVALALIPALSAAPQCRRVAHYHRYAKEAHTVVDRHPMFSAPLGGSWYWMRAPEEEKQAASALFNRYCIRCHGVDGRGVWDIPGIPNFAHVRFQASRSEDQLARAIMQGRGAVMPPFRGALTLEEAWALARYVRTFVPGTEVSRPDESEPEKAGPELVEPGKPAPKAKPQATGQKSPPPSAENLPAPKTAE